jgi:hypothetical protein
MLLLDDVKNFFEKNNIALEEERPLAETEIDLIYLHARDQGYSFATFIHYAVISPEKSGILTCFSSWEQLYDCYLAFLVGFLGNKA